MKPVQSRARRRAAAPPPRILLLLPLVLAVSAIYLVHSRANVFPPKSAVQGGLATLSKRSDPGAHDPYAHDVPCYIPYHQIYAKLPPWLGIALLVLWLMFLFSFLGIVASDFFCPNLSTLASRLGLPEDVAGATMVGWANGAPDLFSTFASIKAGSGSLAIGELIGAASFICSVVAGSMVLVKPFKVSKFNFFRDVGFFTVAVAFALNILRDGRINAWEANLMIVLYVVYVVFVAVASYWRRRRRRQKDKERMIRQAWDDRVPDVTISDASRQDDADMVDLESSHTRQSSHAPRRTRSLSPLVIPSLQVTQGEDYFSSPAPISGQQSAVTPHGDIALPSPGVISVSSGRRRATSVTTPSGRHTPTNAFPTGPRHHAHSSGHARSTSQHAIHMQGRMSLLGAIEFRDVVNSLHADSSTSKHLAGFEFPPSGPASTTSSVGRGHRRTRSGRRRGSSSEPEEGLTMAGSPRPRPSRPGTYHDNGHEPEPAPESRRRAISGPAEPESALVRRNDNLLDVDDPWKNAPTPESRSRGPSLSVQQSAEAVIPDWSTPAGDLEGTESTAGDSDVTARPLHATSSSDTNSANPNRALSHFPSKALKVLGMSGSEAQEHNIPPKAQRLLGTTEVAPKKARLSWRGLLNIAGALVYALFPTLHHFRHKGILNMVTSIISTPAVLLLNLTLPVVDESVPADDFIEQMEKEHLESELVDEEGAIRLSSDDEDDIDDDDSEVSIRDLRHRQNELDLEARERPESALDEAEREERLEQLRVQIARAQEIHSPVATRLHHSHSHSHSNTQSRSNSDPEHAHSHHLTVAGGHLAVPGAAITTNAHSIDHEDESATEDTVVNNVAVGVAALPILEGEQELRIGDGVDEHQLARYLTATQCLLAPIFAVAALFGDDLKIWYLPAATGVGLALSAISLIFFTDPEHVTRVLTLCVIGFVIAVVWILTIVNEVVGVLQTIGHILNLSDAILGLTIFAMGNSLGDLVANVTVARMGYPLMALSACFGGPMLNILLGIGFSGTYMTAITHQPVIIKMNTTLFVSGISLLAVLLTTLISVPLNGFVMSRRWAYGIMLVYLAVMTANVVVEVRSTK